MKKTFKRCSAVLLVLAMILAFSACSTTPPATSTPPTNPATDAPTTSAPPTDEPGDEPVDYTGTTLRVAWWGDDIRANMTNEILDIFKIDYPGLDIQIEYAGWGDYFTKLNTQAAGSQMPDVIQMDYSMLTGYAENNLLTKLYPYIDSKAINLTNVSDTMVSGGIVNGEMYAITMGVNARVMFYDPAVLAQAGVTMSASPTWSEFMNVSEAVFNATGIKNMVFSYNKDDYGDDLIEMYARGLGGNLYAADNKSLAYTPDMLTGLWDMMLTAHEKGYALEPGEYDGENINMIADKASWVIKDNSNLLEKYIEASGTELVMCEYPVADNATIHPTYLRQSMFWCVPVTTNHTDIAMDFINFFVNDERVYDVCGTNRGMPISSAILEYLAPRLSDTDRQISEYIAYLSDGRSSDCPAPAPSAAAEAFALSNAAFEQLAYGQYTRDQLPEVTADLITRMNKLLSDAN